MLKHLGKLERDKERVEVERDALRRYLVGVFLQHGLFYLNMQTRTNRTKRTWNAKR